MAKINNLTLGVGIALAGILLPASLYAGADSAAVAATAKSAITGDLGINFVSAYISRGAPQEIKGTIAQPYSDLYFSLYEDEGFVNKVSLNLGIWGSLHSKKTFAAADSTLPAWYEFDYMPGVAVTFAKNYTLTASYFEFDSPSSAFASSRNLNFNLAYNDADLLGVFALHPHVTYLRELSGKAVNAASTKEGNYFEVGVVPALPAYGPVTISFPVNAGFGSSDFYPENKAFGYFSGGVNASVAIACIPAKYGSWAFNAGATYYRLPSTLAYAVTAPGVVDEINKNRMVYQAGIGATF